MKKIFQGFKIKISFDALIFKLKSIIECMKKITLFLFCEFMVLLFGATLNAQNASPTLQRCMAATPTAEWDAMFNQLVEITKQQHLDERSKSTNYVIPVIFHVIYGTQAIGQYPNLSQAQINSQIQVLNDDYAGTGYNTNKYVNVNGHLPFYDYAVAYSLPSPDNAGVVIANTGISFILATKDQSGTLLAEPGIDRISYSSFGWADPASFTNLSNFKNYMDATVKPSTIWDPTLFFNVWVSDCNSQVSILGYSTFPNGTSLSGLSGGGSGSAQATTDGCWIYAKACGNTGSLDPTYNKGRTLTHESGHYFGLRHVWGDGTCATDYCNDIHVCRP